MTSLAIIGGSGVYALPGLIEQRLDRIVTPYGTVECSRGQLQGIEVVFLARHGAQHRVPPHRVNYRANIAALRSVGVEQVLASNAVGGIHPELAPGTFVVPDQLIDYTWGRVGTFYDDFEDEACHVDMTQPFNEPLRLLLLDALGRLGVPTLSQGTYGCVQGPRLETAAEVRRLRNDGCDMVGMTAMPEAALAREAGLPYASVCFSVNWAAGLQAHISMQDIALELDKAKRLLDALWSSCVQRLL